MTKPKFIYMLYFMSAFMPELKKLVKIFPLDNFDYLLKATYYKNTMMVDLPETDFSFHEDNHKVKEITEVTSCNHEVPFIETYHPPRFMSRKIINKVKGNDGRHGKLWAVISLTIQLNYLHGKKSLLQVSLPFCVPFQITLGQKMTEDLKDINLSGCI